MFCNGFIPEKKICVKLKLPLYKNIFDLQEADDEEIMYGIASAEDTKWTNIVIKGPFPYQRNKFNYTYMLIDLKPKSNYQVLVQAKNEFGWSERSDIFKFKTAAKPKLPKKRKINY